MFFCSKQLVAVQYEKCCNSSTLHLKTPGTIVTCICDKLLKRLFPLVSLQKSRHIIQQTRPKTTTWHFADPRSLPSDREKGKKEMTAALDLTSNAGERVRKKKELHLCRDSLLEEPGKRRAISLSFSLCPSIYPSLPLCVSLSSKLAAD